MKFIVGDRVFEGTPQEIAEAAELFRLHQTGELKLPRPSDDDDDKPVTAVDPLTTVLKPVKAPKDPAAPPSRARGIGAIRTKNKFYSRLRFERAKHGWTVNHMGELLGCSKSTYSLLENSKAPANIVQYTTLSEALGVTPAELFNAHGFALGFTPTRVIEE